ncbi:NAD(P)H dehydrogenase (quinone) [Pirellula staleyi DSM 6068]|uniref:FMN dependent NADH:quinone oxidoreductase n=1 Tax=Pirellula staleyi (strain ATCC 27377 / DSM 6068 / ICPB 4128) TaxID=530564 RepID=D2QX37_PIRSD|nr:NAD(P)H-dependent oxidoreductase [Pirellula staleyi]ADB17877.1 NAD(P)H dehydrogenase (quinone) [Pirellula staleyi DSM 6068]
MRLLHVDASARYEGSTSRELSAFFVAQLRLRLATFDVDYLDLAQDPPPHVSAIQTAAHYTAPQDHTREMRESIRRSDLLVDQLLASHACVFAMPMYNYAAPSTFKAYIDNVVRSGRTFESSPGGIRGLLADRPLLFITSRGGDYAQGGSMAGQDLLVPWLQQLFCFLGASEMTFVSAQPMQFAGPEAKIAGLEAARHQLADIATRWGARLS